MVWDIILGLLVLGALIILFLDKADSGSKIAWFFVITLLPVVGLVLYLMFGLNFRHKWFLKRRHSKSVAYFQENSLELFGQVKRFATQNSLREEYRPLATMISSSCGIPATEGNDVEIIIDGRRKFEALKADLLAAKESIHVEYYHFGNDASSKVIKEILMLKAREGVQVRFLYENVANFPIASHYYNSMKKAGVEITRFSTGSIVTKLNYRNHRKIVVIDGRVAYTGGMNINEHYFFKWRDTHMRLTGPVVESLQFLFMDSWMAAGGRFPDKLMSYFKADAADGGKIMQVIPDEPDYIVQPIRLSYEWVLHNARSYIWFQTPYFVPIEPVLDALKAAALSGVDVRLMLPEVPDNLLTRWINGSYFDEVLAAGVKIYLRKEFIHAKTFVSDDYISCIGSANMDNRSFNINYEVNTMIYDTATAIENKEIFLRDLRDCRPLSAAEWSARPWYRKLLEIISRFFAALL